MNAINHQPVRAPLRWAGSKRKSLPALRRHVPTNISHYIEPFAGSACLAFSIRPQSIVLGDINEKLVEFYTHLQHDPKDLHQRYSALVSNPARYYEVRAAYNEAQPSSDRAAQFLYLNRNCFNGIYRVNAAGRFNVPWGGEKVGKPLTEQDLVDASRALQNATFVCADFESVVSAHLEPGAFVYLDPPYASNEARVFREYDEKSFATSDWDRLMNLLNSIHNAGAFFLLSYAGAPAFASALGNWNAGHLDVTRNIGGFRASRRKHREFMATNLRQDT